MKSALVILSGVTVEFEQWGVTTRALADVNLTIFKGDWIIADGANGSGKSTMLRLLFGQIAPTSGTISFETDEKLLNARSYYVHQNPLNGTSPRLSLLENLWLADKSAPRSRADAKSKYELLLSTIGLEDRLAQPIEQLSSGQRQIVAMQMASLQDATLVLLDEPTTALDPDKELVCLQMIQRLSSEGRTIVQISHSERHASLLGNRRLTFSKGRIAETTRPYTSHN